MPDQYAQLPGVQSLGGVALNAPPTSILQQATEMVRAAMAEVPDGSKGVLVGVATARQGVVDVNLALASKVGDHVDIAAWIGKSWGEPVSAGVVGRVHF